MSSDQKHVRKRGGTFSRKQLTIIQQYLQTGELPSKESLLDISFLSNGRSGRFKAICRRFILVDDKVTHVSGKSVVPKEDFICEIAKAHKGETGEPHLNFEKTLKKLTEMFTVGKRTYGMSKKLIEAVVKACNTGSCKEKKTKKKKEYDDAVKKYARKCSVNKSASTAVKNNVENVKTKMTKTTGKKVKKHAPNKGKSTELAHTIIKCGPKIKKDKKMSTLVQMLNKLVVTTPSTVTTSQPDTITIGPFPVSVVKSVSGSSQYQLVLPILNQQLTSSQNTVYTNTTVLKLPITCMNISTASNISGLVQHETPGVNGNLTGNTTKIPPLPVNMSFTTLLQSVARNSLASSNTQISSSTCNPPAPTEKLQDRSPPSTNCISDNSLKPPDMIINIPVDTGKTPSLKVLLKQAIKNQSIKYSRSATSTQEPPKKKSKTVKQILKCKNKLETVNTSKERVVKEDGDCFFVTKEGGDNDKSNNNCSHDSKSCIDDNREFDEDRSDEDYKALELIKNCGIYRYIPMEDFNMVMDRMTTNIFSEGPNPYSVPFSTVTDLPFPHLWYFPYEIRQEENIFLRIMIVMKDIRIDMTRSIMQEHGALDRLKKKIMYMQNMIKRDKVFLDTGVTKSMKQMKKEADIKPIHRRKQCLTPKTS